MKKFIMFLLGFIFMAEAGAASKAYMRSGTTETSMESEGVKFLNMKGAKANPLPFPNGKNCYSLDDHSKRYNLFKITDLWRYEQVLGRWFAPGGSLIFARMKLPIPEGVKKTFNNYPDEAQKEDFQAWRESAELKISGEQDIVAWLEHFTGSKLKKDEEFNDKKTKIQIDHYVSDNVYKDVYCLADPENQERRYVMIFEFDQNSDIKKSAKNVQTVVSTASFFTPKKDESVDDKKLVTRNSVDIKNHSPEYIASRDKIIAEIRNLSGWKYVETENYIFTANIRNRKLVDEIQLSVEKCRSVCEKYFPQKEPFKAIGVVKSFESRNEFLKYINAPDTYAYIGVWYPSKGELILSPVSENKKNNRETMIRCLEHEVFHQYMYNACGIITPSPWFNEGMAILFEGLEFKKDGFDVNQREFRLSRFNKNGGISKRILEELLHRGYSNIDSRDAMLNFEARIWALMYFINKGAALMNKKEYVSIPFKYYDALYDSKDPAKATEDAWSGIDLEAFSKDMAEFYNSKKLMSRAEKYDIMKNRELLPKDSTAEKLD